jgi:hypothetical protein
MVRLQGAIQIINDIVKGRIDKVSHRKTNFYAFRSKTAGFDISRFFLSFSYYN